MKTGDLFILSPAQSQESTREAQSTSEDVSVFSDTILKCHGKISGGDLGALPGKTKLYGSSSLGTLISCSVYQVQVNIW